MESEAHPHLLLVLDGLVYPATKQDVILHAENNGASEEVLDQLQAMPEDEFNNRQELLEKVTVIEDLPGHENLWSSAPPAFTGARSDNTDIAG